MEQKLWGELNGKEKKEVIDKTINSIRIKGAVNLYKIFREINPEIHISLNELFTFMRNKRVITDGVNI